MNLSGITVDTEKCKKDVRDAFCSITALNAGQRLILNQNDLALELLLCSEQSKIHLLHQLVYFPFSLSVHVTPP